MESSSKKRKLSGGHRQPEDEDDIEKAKIEKFFALLEGFKEARDRLLMSSDQATLKQEIRKLDRREETVTVWKPCFEAEDFLDEASQAKNHGVEGSQRNEVIAEKEESKNGLDLSLSL